MPDHLLDLPRQLGRYEVIGPLASGGMAEVLLARLTGPQGFERVVVIKRILPHLARIKEFVEMFADEARIVAGIRHPNVVAVHELGRESGELFLVLEYLEGESASGLARRLALRDAQLDHRLSIHIVSEACAGLHAAHELTDPEGGKQNLVHRDMSPQNVFITYDGQVKVLDFGIAKAADRMTRTEAGQVKGKFQYMSPEQTAGKALDRRCDIFALGIVLYEMSTGYRLFKRATDLMALKAICEEPIRPPSSLRPDYPKSLEHVVLRALERDPSRRFQTALDMRRALLRVLDDLPSSDVLPEEDLADLMRACFADRIEIKGDMLRRVRSGSQPTEVPAAETDGAVEIPAVFEDETLASTAAASDSTRQRQRRVGAVIAGVGVILGLTVGTFALLRRTTPSPIDRAAAMAAPTSTSANAPASAPIPSGSPAVPTVSVEIETVPSEATATVASSGGERSCVTPCTLLLDRSEASADIVVDKSGFVLQHEPVRPNVDQRIHLTLQTMDAGGRNPSPRRTTPAPKPTATPFKRFD
jgi:eukaryotic-like serine/threonine-protein kinase